MSYRVRYTKTAKEDLQRLYNFLLDHDLQAARRAREAIGKSMEFLRDFPFACRTVMPDNPFLREMLIPSVVIEQPYGYGNESFMKMIFCSRGAIAMTPAIMSTTKPSA
ncbi:MAG: type II toxin-antitoxin system RelE/ParE family toxin [Proteobacteria bacterium]|nr:type II toxin-antitoxin system RelE/ParE family toxin [Pseudomonadota bacterium]MBU0967477.1 type II toxin-antitoxin system RelE/ParE family toxin [Pseudomonadota bacterium]